MFYFFHPSAGHAIADAYVLGLEDTMIVCDIQSQEIVEEHHSKPLIGQLRQLQHSYWLKIKKCPSLPITTNYQSSQDVVNKLHV